MALLLGGMRRVARPQTRALLACPAVLTTRSLCTALPTLRVAARRVGVLSAVGSTVGLLSAVAEAKGLPSACPPALRLLAFDHGLGQRLRHLTAQPPALRRRCL